MSKTQALSKKNDWRRRVRSFARHAFLFSKPFAIATASAVLWYKLHARGIHFSGGDASIVGGPILSMLSVIYSIMAAIVLHDVWDKFRKVGMSLLRNDKETFLLYRDERMPVLLHMLLFLFTFPIVAIVALLDYQSILAGALSVFAVSLLFSFYWFVVNILENPVESPWLKERIPPEWLSIDVDEYFKLGSKTSDSN